MNLKDYYGILELEPSATQTEIKKAFRKLAHLYHPDKNKGDPYALAQFTEVKEAYEVLTNPAKKDYYLQQRWYQQSIGKKKTYGAMTPVAVLKQVLELEKYVSTLDVHRMDKQGLADHIHDILSGSVIGLLLPFNEPQINHQIILAVLKAMRPLSSGQTEMISGQLFKLANEQQESKTPITLLLASKKQKEKAERFRPWILLAIVALLCLLIWLMGT